MDWKPATELDSQRFLPQEVFAAGLSHPASQAAAGCSYRVPAANIGSLYRQAWQAVERMGLYVHIPWGEAHCAGDEYPAVPLAPQALDLYLDLVVRELEVLGRLLGTADKTLVGFDIGGGTPTLAGPAPIARILETVRRACKWSPGLTISIETSPRIAARDPQKIRTLYRLGIERMSMGVQVMQPSLVHAFGRTGASVNLNMTAAEHIRAAGCKLNLDVVYGLPGQSMSSWEASVDHAIRLDPESICLHRMPARVGRDTINAMYALACGMLHAAGYRATLGQSSFSRLPGDRGTSDCMAQHIAYGTPCLGVGLGAQSLSHTTLSRNVAEAEHPLALYRGKLEAGEPPVQELYHLSRRAAMGKMIEASFYLGEIDLAGFERKFGCRLQEAFRAEVEFLLQRELMTLTSHSLRLTSEGVRCVEGIVPLFYSGAAQARVLEAARKQEPALLAVAA